MHSLLAHAFPNGELRRAELEMRGAEPLGREWQWLGPFPARFLNESRREKPRLGDASRCLLRDEAFCSARVELRIAKWTPSNGVPATRWEPPQLAGPAARPSGIG